MIARTNQAHFDQELLRAENVHSAQTTHIAKTIN
jgi:hypothetical protein